MCGFEDELDQAIKEYVEKGEPFDMEDIKHAVRDLCDPSMPVLRLPCKYETLAAFERGKMPGYKLVTKLIELDGEPEPKSVFNFVPETPALPPHSVVA